jgi:hypothetical protein
MGSEKRAWKDKSWQTLYITLCSLYYFKGDVELHRRLLERGLI